MGKYIAFCPLLPNVKAAGYDGIEMALPLEADARQVIVDTIREHDLEFIGQYWQSFERDLDEHGRNYEKYLRNLVEAQPLFINCQTGKDFFYVRSE